MLHTFNDENSVAKDEPPVPIQEDTHENKTKEEQEHLEKKVAIRVTKNISDYMPKNKVINVDGEEGITVLDSIFDEIKDQIKKDLRVGKKITLQL